jgi:hypothetical protein
VQRDCKIEISEDNDTGRLLKTITNFAGKRLMYSKLIGEDGDDLPPQTAIGTTRVGTQTAAAN